MHTFGPGFDCFCYFDATLVMAVRDLMSDPSKSIFCDWLSKLNSLYDGLLRAWMNEGLFGGERSFWFTEVFTSSVWWCHQLGGVCKETVQNKRRFIGVWSDSFDSHRWEVWRLQEGAATYIWFVTYLCSQKHSVASRVSNLSFTLSLEPRIPLRPGLDPTQLPVCAMFFASFILLSPNAVRTQFYCSAVSHNSIISLLISYNVMIFPF